MFSLIVLSAIALTAAQASILPCGTDLPLPGYPAVGGVSSNPLGERVIANNCRCTKTIVRPKVSQCVVNVPTSRRVVQNSISNVVENIPYRTGSPYLGCGVSLDGCTSPGFGSLAPYLGCGTVGAAPFVDAVAPVNLLPGCGASLDGYISPVIGAGVPLGAINGCGLGYSGCAY